MRGDLAAHVRVDRVGIRRTAMADAAWIAIGAWWLSANHNHRTGSQHTTYHYDASRLDSD
jgi:hypothetical protein